MKILCFGSRARDTRARRLARPLTGILLPLLVPMVASAVTLTRGPYLQQVGETSAMIVWRTSTAVACTLGYAPPGSAQAQVVTSARTEHVVALNELAPGTRYEYTIRSGGLLAGGPEFYIRTAPVPGSGATQRLLVWGDSGFGNSTQMAVAAAMNVEDAHMALVVGDIIQTSGEAYYYDPRYFQPYAPLLRHTPAWGVLGNHDMGEPSSFYDAWFLPTNPIDGTERFYSFDYGDIHVVALDTNKPMTTAILDWLAADLDATTRRWKFVFYHHTVYSCGDYHGSTDTWIRILAPVFEAHGVDLAFNGHDHHYERSYPMVDEQPMDTSMDPDYVSPAGPIYVISGAAGSPRSASESCEHTARAIGSTPCFVRIAVTGDQLTLEAVNTQNAVLDRMTLSKSGTPPPPPPPPPPATIHITSPSGGESFDIGDPITIRWTASSSLSSIRVELSRTDASGPWETLTASTSNDGQYNWTATAPASATCWLRLSDAADGDPSDLTDTSFGISSGTVIEPPPTPSLIGINFQPESAFAPPGYVDDTGQPFDVGEGFGWSSTMLMQSRQIHPEDPRDTFVDVVNNAAPGVWEIALANGYYRVSLVCGDPVTTATHRVALEGRIVVRDVHTIADQYHEVVISPVLVSDGRLTMTVGASDDITHSKVNAILIAEDQPAEHSVTAPAGGEEYCTGAQVPLRWSGATVGALVRIDVSRSGPGGPWVSLGATDDDGEESWMASGPATTDCFFRIVDPDGTVLAQSAAPFAIVDPVLHLLRPAGGEVWTTGSVRSFEWQSSCLAGNVRIDVSRSGPSGPWTTLIPSTINDGFESYTVRREDVGWTHVRVVALPFEIPSDQNDAPITVLDGAAPPRSWHFDFLPTDATPAYGYVAEHGLVYDPASGYGWNAPVVMKKRDMLANDCRDHFVQVVNTSTATWSLDLPNGQYFVSLVCGDPFTSATHRVALEGEIVIADVYAVGGNYVVRNNIPVYVAGRPAHHDRRRQRSDHQHQGRLHRRRTGRNRVAARPPAARRPTARQPGRAPRPGSTSHRGSCATSPASRSSSQSRARCDSPSSTSADVSSPA